MKPAPFLLSLFLLLSPLFFLTSCEEDEDDNNVTPYVYFTAKLKLNSSAPSDYVCNEYMFRAAVDTTANDTLFFEGERSSDGSYMYFNLITDDPYKYTAGDSINIPYDIPSGTEVFCSLLINSLSTTIFQPGGSGSQGKVFIDEIDYSKKYLKGRFYGSFYAFNDTLEVTEGTFLIDE